MLVHGEKGDARMKKRHTALRGKKEAVQSSEQLQERIRRRAYELYEARGREDGRDLDDWLKAESEVTGNAESAMARR